MRALKPLAEYDKLVENKAWRREMLNRKLHVPLYIQLKDRLLEMIQSEHYQLGDVIPSEPELMKTYSVGRATVREAINALVNEGLLEKQQGKGTYIRRKETSLGFEPLISLSYSLGIRGWSHQNVILKQQVITLDGETKVRTQINGDRGLHLSRNRLIDGHELGLETFYFHAAFIAMCEGKDLSKSIGKLMLEELKLPVVKLLQEVTLSKVDGEEAAHMKLLKGSDVMHMKRWLFIEGYEGCFQYYELKVPVGVSAFPTDLL